MQLHHAEVAGELSSRANGSCLYGAQRRATTSRRERDITALDGTRKNAASASEVSDVSCPARPLWPRAVEVFSPVDLGRYQAGTELSFRFTKQVFPSSVVNMIAFSPCSPSAR